MGDEIDYTSCEKSMKVISKESAQLQKPSLHLQVVYHSAVDKILWILGVC